MTTEDLKKSLRGAHQYSRRRVHEGEECRHRVTVGRNSSELVPLTLCLISDFRSLDARLA
jgi:hypothetical protein